MNEKLIVLNLLHNQNLIEPLDTDIDVIRKFIGIQAQINNNAMYAISIRNKNLKANLTNDQVYKVWSLRGTVHNHLSDETDLITQLLEKDNFASWDKTILLYIDPKTREKLKNIALELIGNGINNRKDMLEEFLKLGINPEQANFACNSYGGSIKDLVYNGKVRFSGYDSGNFIVNSKKNYSKEEIFEFSKSITKRYFEAYGPATFSDFLHWSGVKSASAKSWLEPVKNQLNTFTLGKKTYYYVNELRDNLNEMPKCLFLTGFDPFTLAHKEKTMWLEDEYRPLIRTVAFFKNIILIDGYCVGTWKQGKGILEITLFKEVDSDTRNTILSYAESSRLLDFNDCEIIIASK